MTIGQVADHLSLNVQTIRFYEREGLLPRLPRSAAGYRLFDAEAVKRIYFVKHAQEVGFTLREIGELLALRVSPDGSCNAVKQCATDKIAQLDERMKRLRKMKRTLQNLSAMCDDGRDVSDCPILEALDVSVH